MRRTPDQTTVRAIIGVAVVLFLLISFVVNTLRERQ
jgi:hypothetical protein